MSDLAALRRHPGYSLFYATATITRLVDEMLGVAVVLLILDRTDSAALAGLTIAAVTLPSIVTGPLLGAWLDRSASRRWLMIADQVLAAISIVLIVLLTGNAPDFVVPLVALIAGITWPLSFGGFTSLIPVIVPDRLLSQANALEATSFNTAIIGGPALAGTLCALFSPEASLILEAVLTLAVIALIVRIKAMDREPEREARELGEILRDGLGHLARTPPLRGVSVAAALSLGGLGLLTVAFPFFAVDHLGSERSAAGFLWSSFALGSMVGAMALVRVHRIWRPERIMLFAMFGVGALMLTWPLADTLLLAMALIALTGFVDGPGLAATFGARQAWTPPHLLGQIFTTAVSMKVGALSLGAAAAGPAVVTFGADGTIAIAAGCQFAGVAIGLALGAWRDTTARVEPAEPELAARAARLDLQEDDGVHDHRDREPDRPAVQVALDE
jgi:predicted MFS family arabinose efflux permease